MLSRIFSSSVILFSLWLLLSGHYGPLLLSLGALSCVFVAWCSYKLGLLDPKSATLKFIIKLPIFLPWFFFEVIKSNLDVSLRILHPKLPIEPNLMTLAVSQHSDLGKAVFANCITLTPGTYSLDIDGRGIEVHSLTKALADDLQNGEMSKRIKALEAKSQTDNTN